jgi:hypothetical protein
MLEHKMTATAMNNVTGQTKPRVYDQELRQKASEFVNQVFYGTLLREFRNAQPPGMFNQGPGAATFVRQLDMELITRISRGGDSPMTEALLKRLSRGREIQNVLNQNNSQIQSTYAWQPAGAGTR